MSLTQALSTALSGLTVTQTSMSLVAGNVANAQTPGYVRKTPVITENASGTTGGAVQIDAINRVLDQFVQAQMRTESAGAGYADSVNNMYNQLQGIYGTPGSSGTLESSFNDFTTALQSLGTTPNDGPTQLTVLSSAQALTQQLNSMSSSIQSLRGEAELGISQDVDTANNDLQQIAQINKQLASYSQQDSAYSALEDQRDVYIDQISKLMDVRVISSDNNQVSLLTSSGVQLVSGSQASTLSFNAQGAMSAQSQWNADPSKSTVGTITLTSPNGAQTDLIANGAIRSGEIAGYLQMRDSTLVQAQTQLDQFAGALSSALSDQTTQGNAATSGAQNGFDVDVGSLSAGNTVSITYTDTATNTQHQLTLMRVDDSSALPLKDSATSDPNDKVVGIDFSGGMASVVSQINAAIGSTGMTASNPSGTTLRVLDDGAANTVDVNAMSTTATATSLTGSVQLPMLTDGGQPYTGAVTSQGSESVGLAGRITVNASLLANPNALVAYQAGTASADATRPNFIYDQIASGSLTFSPSAGIGSAASPYSGTLSSYISQITSVQSTAANNATNLQQGQDVVLSALQQRFSSTSGVNIDQEMSNLLNLQNAYAANARVMTTVNTMLTALMQMGL
jgi:flagellar hook-associated protein 1 FlgK